MKYIRFLLLFMMILLLCITTSSCIQGDGVGKEKMCLSDKNIIDLVSKKYGYSQLLEISQLEATIDELNKKYPIECLKKIETAYRVSYLGDDSVAVVYFDSDGNKIMGKVYRLYLTRNDFDGITIGQSLKYVQKIDPNGEYLFLYTGRDDTPKVSTHYTKDGYVITIEYNKEDTVLSMEICLI